MTPRVSPATRARSVYVHAPFCARRCAYCDFAVQVRARGDTDAWLEALAAELAWLEGDGLLTPAPRLDTLYVGGGTPSLLGADAMTRLAGVLGQERVSDPELEWTAEANPESLTDEVARGWAAAGVNRLSLGVQSFHDDTLRWMGRLHGSEGPARAVEAARRAGIDSLSVDLIFGLPDSVGRSWKTDLERALALDVGHVSLYGLTVEEGTPLARWVAQGRVVPVDDERYRDEYLLAADVLTAAGYDHYEVSNFARPGARSRHNTAYWTGVPYLGLGNGAHSFAPPVRRWNVREWDAYVSRLLQGEGPEAERETVAGPSARLERIWLALRTDAGWPLDPEGAAARRLAGVWQGRGWAEIVEGRLRLTPEGWLLLDRLAVELDAALDAVRDPALA